VIIDKHTSQRDVWIASFELNFLSTFSLLLKANLGEAVGGKMALPATYEFITVCFPRRPLALPPLALT
jgi:hypothetical protein